MWWLLLSYSVADVEVDYLIVHIVIVPTRRQHLIGNGALARRRYSNNIIMLRYMYLYLLTGRNRTVKLNVIVFEWASGPGAI